MPIATAPAQSAAKAGAKPVPGCAVEEVKAMSGRRPGIAARKVALPGFLWQVKPAHQPLDPAVLHRTSRTMPVSAARPIPEFAPEPHPVETLPGSLESGVLILCDHASNAVPEDLGDLGLPETEFRRHIAYDIGAAAVTR